MACGLHDWTTESCQKVPSWSASNTHSRKLEKYKPRISKPFIKQGNSERIHSWKYGGAGRVKNHFNYVNEIFLPL